jgi:hypothetical protein
MLIIFLVSIVIILVSVAVIIFSIDEDDKNVAVMTCLVSLVFFFIILFKSSPEELTSNSFYEYNQKILDKHYLYENKIYKVIIDTTATNEYIKKQFLLKGK